MKKSGLLLLALGLIMFLIPSCSKVDKTTANYIAQQGKWKITLFNDRGTDKTANFTGYEFTFAASGTATAAKTGVASTTGTWSTIFDSSQDKFILNLGTSSLFEKLAEDWDVTQKTSANIKLQQGSGGGGYSYLTFQPL